MRTSTDRQADREINYINNRHVLTQFEVIFVINISLKYQCDTATEVNVNSIGFWRHCLCGRWAFGKCLPICFQACTCEYVSECTFVWFWLQNLYPTLFHVAVETHISSFANMCVCSNPIFVWEMQLVNAFSRRNISHTLTTIAHACANTEKIRDKGREGPREGERERKRKGGRESNTLLAFGR